MATVVSKVWICRIAAALGVMVALTMTLSLSARMLEPDSWAYYYAAENFGQGLLVVSDSVHQQQVAEARESGGSLIQYVRLDDGNWALEKSPGYVFFLVPFHKLGIPYVANLLLALGMAAVTYLCLKRLKNEMAACIGVLLMFFMPMSLIMLHRPYMAMFGATAFLVMGAGLYLYETVSHERSPRPWVLFLAGLLMSWSVVARYANVAVVAIFVLHFGMSRGRWLFEGRRWDAARETAPFLLGLGISAAVLLAYNSAVFGSPWDYGYEHTRSTLGHMSFAFERLGDTSPEGRYVPWEIISGNVRNMPLALLIGFPVLAVVVPGMAYAMWRGRRGWLIRLRKSLSRATEHPRSETSCAVLALLTGWFLAVFGLFFLYEWTSQAWAADLHYMAVDRFYLPGLFPLVVAAALLLASAPRKVTIGLMTVIIVVGSALFAQAATVDHLG